MRWLADIAIVFGMVGCAFDPGQPWGVLEPSLHVRFDPPADRLLSTGGFRTAADYGVELDTLTVQMVDLRVQYAAEAGQAFDPSKPPPGYTLCHGGHCHSVDGRLVDYAQVAAEQGGGGALSVDLPIDGTVTVTQTPVLVRPSQCPNDCALERGRLAFARVRVAGLTATGRVRDLLPGSPRLPAQGVTIQGQIPLDLTWTAQLAAEVGRGEALGVRVQGDLRLAVSLFDGVAWGDLPRVGQAIDLPSAWPVAVRQDASDRLRLDSVWTVKVTRF